MEAGEYGLTRGTCFLACRLELDDVAGLLWISWCVFGGADYSSFFFPIFFVLRTHTAYCKYEATLPHVPLSTSNEAVLAFRQKSFFLPGCVQGAII